MNTPQSFSAAATLAACLVSNAFAQDLVAPAPLGQGATTVYRQVMPDGRVVYSDKVMKGGKIDHTITIEPPIKGNLWSTESGAPVARPPRNEPTSIEHVASIPRPDKRMTVEEATSDVIRAEMLLEDARKRQQAGAEPLPGERSGTVSGGSRLNEAYARRQQALAKQVADTEAMLAKAVAARDALRNAR